MEHVQGSGGLAFTPSASIPSWQPDWGGGAGVALNPAGSVGLIQVGAGGSEQVRDCFSAASRSTGNPAFPVPWALGADALTGSVKDGAFILNFRGELFVI